MVSCNRDRGEKADDGPKGDERDDNEESATQSEFLGWDCGGA
jgi:hypothetical protein